MDSLFLMMVEKMQTINLLDRLQLDKAYSGVKKEIKLIQKVIGIKKPSENTRHFKILISTPHSGMNYIDLFTDL